MSLAVFVSLCASAIEGLVALCALLTGVRATIHFYRDERIDGALLATLMVVGAFCLVALDAARRGAGL